MADLAIEAVVDRFIETPSLGIKTTAMVASVAAAVGVAMVCLDV